MKALHLAYAPMQLLTKTRELVDTFAFRPASPRPHAAFRIGLSTVLLLQAWMMSDVLLDFSTGRGVVQREIAETLADPLVPRLSTVVDFLQPLLGLGESTIIMSTGCLYVLSLLFLLLGGFTRSASIIAWFLHWTLTNTGYSGAYGADMYAHIFLFYLMWMPAGGAYSLDRLWGRTRGEASSWARFTLRLVQLHMCISYCTSGIEKATGAQWWNGEIIWKALNFPGYSRFDFYWLVDYPLIPTVLGLGTLVIETFYCLAIWPRQTRMLWVIATCGLHLGIVVFLRLPVFGLLMCVPTLTLFGLSAEERN
jgi:hypothetical protein